MLVVSRRYNCYGTSRRYCFALYKTHAQVSVADIEIYNQKFLFSYEFLLKVKELCLLQNSLECKAYFKNKAELLPRSVINKENYLSMCYESNIENIN